MSFVLSCFALGACTSAQEKNPEPATPKASITSQEVTGMDMFDKTRSCAPMAADRVCTMIFTPADSYANKCSKEGHKPVQCACHDWICIKN